MSATDFSPVQVMPRVRRVLAKTLAVVAGLLFVIALAAPCVDVGDDFPAAKGFRIIWFLVATLLPSFMEGTATQSPGGFEAIWQFLQILGFRLLWLPNLGCWCCMSLAWFELPSVRWNRVKLWVGVTTLISLPVSVTYFELVSVPYRATFPNWQWGVWTWMAAVVIASFAVMIAAQRNSKAMTAPAASQ